VRRVFVDTSHYVALIDPRDRLHTLAESTFGRLSASPISFVTSEPVLFEVLNYFSRYDAWYRTRAADIVTALRSDSTLQIMPITPDLLDRAITLYKSRADQPYSLTDCASMEICRRLKITDVLTADTDFRNEGFAVLLHD